MFRKLKDTSIYFRRPVKPFQGSDPSEALTTIPHALEEIQHDVYLADSALEAGQHCVSCVMQANDACRYALLEMMAGFTILIMGVQVLLLTTAYVPFLI